MSFQYIILSVAFVMLCIMLIMIGVLLYHQKYTEVFPPVLGSCPDYWEYKKIKNNETNKEDPMCLNVMNLGTCPNKTMDFTTSEFNGTNGLCNKQKWARKCNLSWDGITNNTKACKD